MTKFIEVHNQIISVKNINRVEFTNDDIYLDLFPTNNEGEYEIDFIQFTFAKIYLFDKTTIDVQLDLYLPEEMYKETTDQWVTRNRSYINYSWRKLVESLGEIEKITGYEYEFGL